MKGSEVNKINFNEQILIGNIFIKSFSISIKFITN